MVSSLLVTEFFANFTIEPFKIETHTLCEPRGREQTNGLGRESKEEFESTLAPPNVVCLLFCLGKNFEINKIKNSVWVVPGCRAVLTFQY